MRVEAIYKLFKRNVNVDGNECWNWKGYINIDGYGRMKFRGEVRSVHSVTYELITYERYYRNSGLEFHHKCYNRKCCNPEHLKVVSHGENISLNTSRAPKTHCPQGHPYDEENTYVTDNYKGCRICRREHNRTAYWNRRK